MEEEEDDGNQAPEEDMLCRICLEGEIPGNQFAKVCKCTKTMPVHANCLID